MQVEFLGADNTTYTLSPLQFGDVVEFEEWVRYKPYHDFRKLAKQFPTDAFNRTADTLLLKCAERPRAEVAADSEAYQKSIEGHAYTFYLSARKKHPELKLADVPSIVTAETAKDFVRQQAIVDGIVDTKKNEAAPPPS